MNMMRGVANHRNKRKKAENKPSASPKSQELVRDQQEQEHEEQKIIQSLMSRENAEDAVIRHFEETEGSRKIIANLAEGNNSDMEQWMQIYTASLDWTMNKRRRKQMESDGRLKQGERAQEESQPQHRNKASKCVPQKRRRRRKKRENGRIISWKKEAQGNRYDEDEDERVPVVPNMEAGSSYLQTTYPRDEVEKLVMDGLQQEEEVRM